jgi:hypothetical protein
MNSSRQDEMLMQPHQLEVGIQAKAGLPRRLVAPKRSEGGSMAKAGGRLHGRKYFRARANGFSPRLLGFVGKKTWERGQLVRAAHSSGG